MRHPLVNGPAEPLFGNLPRVSTLAALAEHTPTSTVDPAEQWAETCRTAWVDLALDGDQLLGRPRGAVGYVGEITGALREWARADVAGAAPAGYGRQPRGTGPPRCCATGSPRRRPPGWR